MILEIDNIDTYYGQSHVLQGISLGIDEGEVVSLLGRNGVGKTTTLRSIMGLTPPRRGSIRFQGEEMAGKKPFEIARLGIGYVPDDRRIFPDLTTFENLEIARRMSAKKRGHWNIDTVCDLFPVLRELSSTKGTHLSGGEQKMLAVGRALMKNPELILLDEPAEGLAPLVVVALSKAISEIRDTGVTVFLADQNVRFCRKAADRGYIIEKGSIQYQDQMKNIMENEEIVKKYLAV
ncbi:MAG: ABC transporter ATP-binding protein [Desulfobacterales bacterium]|nr:ABC transporter ATP-binding protein [Desulfobacterales bacterium]